MLSYRIALGTPDRMSALKARPLHGEDPAISEISPGCLIWTSDTGIILPVGDGGAILGTLFHRYGAPYPVEQLSDADSVAIKASRGDYLFERFWGAYIAVLPTASGHLIIRDPSGMLPCNYVDCQGMFLFASEPELLASTGLFEPKLDSAQLARSLFLPAFPSQVTPFDGLCDLLPGMALEIAGRDAGTRLCWNPWDHTVADDAQSIDANAERLQRTAQSCISAWGHVYDRGLVGVSGGLDSSIVATSLKKAGNSISCLTMVTNDPLGDERVYAEAVAGHMGTRLHQAYFDLDDIDLGRSSVSRRARPMGRLDAMAYDAAILRVAESERSNAIFTGNGGDNIFYMSRSARPLADRLMAEGLSLGLWRTWTDLSRLTGASLLKVATHGIGAWRRAGKGYAWQSDASLLTEMVVHDLEFQPIRHPWLDGPEDGALPGKAAHIAMLMRVQPSVEGYDRRGGLAVVHPLLSQPIVELCLSIPTWQQCADGRDRAVARKAFAAQLPAKVVDRRGKGGPDGFAAEIVSHFRDEIRERLLGGYLVAAGIVDARGISQALHPDRLSPSGEILRLLLLVDTEAWIAHWRGN